MEWSKTTISKAELERKQREYMEAAISMAKRAGNNAPTEITPVTKEEIVERIVEEVDDLTETLEEIAEKAEEKEEIQEEAVEDVVEDASGEAAEEIVEEIAEEKNEQFGVFNADSEVIAMGTPSMRLYFCMFIFMSLQMAGQNTFVALGRAKTAIFFSLFRKVIIVVPLTLLLPHMGFGVKGVFMAEPISNVIGGLASYITMRLTVYRKLGERSTKE